MAIGNNALFQIHFKMQTLYMNADNGICHDITKCLQWKRTIETLPYCILLTSLISTF